MNTSNKPGDTQSRKGLERFVKVLKPSMVPRQRRRKEQAYGTLPKGKADPMDPYNLKRFVDGHKRSFHIAMEEMYHGTKLSHWIWFVVPTPPYMVNGEERGSSANRMYAIRSIEEASAFLSYEKDGVNLRNNYLRILRTMLGHMRDGRTPHQLLRMDDVKLRSSVKFFAQVGDSIGDKEVADTCKEVLTFF